MTLTADTASSGCNCHACRNVLPGLIEALAYIARETGRERKALRSAAPTPVAGVDAGLMLIQLAAEHALRADTPLTALVRGLTEVTP